MPDTLLQEDYTPLLQEDYEFILLESALFGQLNNFEFVSAGNGISVTEKM